MKKLFDLLEEVMQELQSELMLLQDELKELEADKENKEEL